MALVYRGISGSQFVYWLEGDAIPAGISNYCLVGEANGLSGSAGTGTSRFGSSMPSYHNISNITYEIIATQADINTVGGIYAMTASGAGASVITNYTAVAGSPPGTSINLNTGTTSSGWAALASALGSGFGTVIFYDGYTVRLRNTVRIDFVADVSQNHHFYSGFINANFPITVGSGGLGCYFYYNYAVNAGKWVCVAGSTTNTTITMNELQTYVLEIEVSSTGQTKFWIDGVLVATLTAPVTTNPMKIIPGTITKTAGASNRNAYLFNPFCLNYEFTTKI